ncbi:MULTISPECIES: DUF397 domain-containing protein [unclassified Streptomyces]|uniref:DUF397 domain-containing protein n=1 Tax=unclassified Streptomyces TaxID=2593676 RepID=UPI00344C829A
MTEDPQWLKSSYSDTGGNCVEVAPNRVPTLGLVPVRDSKVPSGPVLDVSAGAFSAFVEGVKGGQLGA